MKLKKILLTLLFFNIFLFNIIGQENKIEGIDLSNSIYETLIENNYTPIKINLARTQNISFPYNILLTINNPSKSENSPNKFNRMIFSITQEDFLKNKESFLILFNKVKQASFNYNLTFLITSCDNQILDGNNNMTGTNLYCELIEGFESSFSISVLLDSTEQTFITPGTKKNVTPLWLTKLLVDSLNEQKVENTIKGNLFLSLYRLSAFKDSKRLTPFFNKNIPSIELEIEKNKFDSEKLSEIFFTIFNNFNNLKDFQEEIHYIPVKFKTKTYWITEGITIYLLLFLITISLIIFCDFEFIFRNKHSVKTLNTKRAVRNIYLLPILIFLIFICIQCAQLLSYLFYKITKAYPEIILLLKFIFSLIFISIIFSLESKSKKRKILFSYEYFLIISSLSNVFIFSIVDISFFYIFTSIYLICILSNLIKKVLPFIFVVFAICIPYLLIIQHFLSYSDLNEIYNYIFISPLYNLLIGSAITPIFILLLKLSFIIKNNSLTKNKAKTTLPFEQLKKIIQSKFSKKVFIVETILLILTSTIILIIGSYSRKKHITFFLKENLKPQIIDLTQNEPKLLKASYSDSHYYGGTTRSIKIDTTNNAQRVEIFVTGQTDNPIFNSAFTYSQTENSNKVKFDLPDFPPKKFTITFTPDNSKESNIEIVSYYKNDNYKNNQNEKYNKTDVHNKELSNQSQNTNLDSDRIFIKEKKVILINSSESTGIIK